MNISLAAKKIDERPEILAADNYFAVPVLCHGSDVIKAGTPMTAAGAVALDGYGASGILLYDVDPTQNPVGSLVVHGIIDYAKAKQNAGITATAATLQSAIRCIRFRTDIGSDQGGSDPVVGEAVVGKAVVGEATVA